MKRIIKIVFALVLSSQCLRAQDTAIRISKEMFTPAHTIMIGTMEGWYFRPGNDTAWAQKEMELSGWKQLKPTELSVKMADKKGRLEGWFRIKLKLADDFLNMPVGLRYRGWAAADFYLDGNTIVSFGNTGYNGNPFKEYSSNFQIPVPIALKPGIEHTLSIHFVDYKSSLPPFRLKSEENDLRTFIRLTSPEYLKGGGASEWSIYCTIWITAIIILTILFGLLAFLNRREKNLLLFAVCALFFTIETVSIVIGQSANTSFYWSKIWTLVFALFNYLSTSVTVIIIARIFKNKISKGLKIFLALYLLSVLVNVFLASIIILIAGYLAAIAVSLWLIIFSWKTLKGAQWAIVAGLLIRIGFILVCIFMLIIYKTPPFPNFYFIITGVVLSFEIFLLIYVAFRFKEIIREVQQQAAQLLKLSEEKREQAEQQQKILQEEVNKQTAEIRTTLEDLKSTQSQLIQSEKMASLGELTAGIAHEIQNPLNFVNNFSEVSNELIDEMMQEVAKGNYDQVKAIADDVKQNLEKINHHGKRADGIVKGMLQHSRSSSATKEPADINKLADEYLRLAYHGLRAKDKTFNATMKTDYDETIGYIDIIPQDIGRVILNLITNAFYAVTEKKKAPQSPPAGGGVPYEPIVSVSTKKDADKILISVKDNGNGIPQKVLDKIFQPFFTTKPTGQGTGLGLSLSYDIVKTHGGELIVETKEGEGSEFVIVLPY
jgi:two-component system, NtrC family, sensor kinase